MSVVTSSAQPAQRTERPGGLAEVLDVILDKGIVIDAYVRVTLVGIELLTIDARIVIASIDTYLRFAEAVGRLEIGSNEPAPGLPGLMKGVTEGAAKAKTKGALAGAKETVKETASDVVGIFRGEDDVRRGRSKRQPGGGGLTGVKEAASDVVDRFRGDDGPHESAERQTRGPVATVKEAVKDAVKDTVKEKASELVDRFRDADEAPADRDAAGPGASGPPASPSPDAAAETSTAATGTTGGQGGQTRGSAPRQGRVADRGVPSERRPRRR